MLTAVGLKILSNSIFRDLIEISMILVVTLMNFTLVRVEWQMDWLLVINMASGWLKNILVSVPRNWLSILIVNWFGNWLKVSEPFSWRVGRSIVVRLSWNLLFVKSLFLRWSLRVMGDLLLRRLRWDKFMSHGMHWVDGSGVWDNRAFEGMGVFVGKVAWVTSMGI